MSGTKRHRVEGNLDNVKPLATAVDRESEKRNADAASAAGGCGCHSQEPNGKSASNIATNDGVTNEIYSDDAALAIPIFLKKTYTMIETCDPEICGWAPEGDMFVIKDPDVFASKIIPQYFDHNKFASFARQLNFYGFCKVQNKPIRNDDFDETSAKHVTFYNEKFRRGRADLLKEIQRSTRGGGPHASSQDQQRDLESLRNIVSALEHRVSELERQLEDRTCKCCKKSSLLK